MFHRFNVYCYYGWFCAINATTIKVTFNQEVEELAKADVVVTNVKTSDRQYVKEVKLAEDKKTAKVAFYDALVTKNTYKVVVGEAEKEFDYVVADAAKIEAETTQIGSANPTVKYKVLDANGLDITSSTEVEFESNKTIDENGKLTLPVDETAFVYVVIKKDGKEVLRSERITVKAEAPKAVKLVAYTVDGSDFTAKDFKAVTTVQKGDTAKSITLYVEDQFGNKSVMSAKFESLNKEVALVDQNNGKITPIKEGTADVRITIGEFSVVRPIEIAADSKVATLNLEKASIQVSDKVNQSVDVVVKDQYGNKFKPVDGKMTATIKSGSDIVGLNKLESAVFNKDVDTVAFEIQPVEGKEGTATIEFAVGDVKTTLTVVVKKAGTIDSYVVEGFKTKLDKNAANADKNPADMTLKVFGVDANGIKIGDALTYTTVADTTDYKVELKGKDKDGKDIDTTNLATVSGSDAKIAPTAVGTYTATVKVGSLTVYTGEFELVDTTVVSKPVVEQKDGKITVSDVKEVEVGNFFTVTLDGATKVATFKNVEFLSDNSKVAVSGSTVEDDKITILADGEATIILKSATITIDDTDYEKVDLGNAQIKVTVDAYAKAEEVALENAKKALLEANAKIVADDKETDYKVSSWTQYKEALATAEKMPETNATEINEKAKAINDAVKKLVVKDEAKAPELTIKTSDATTFTIEGLPDGATATANEVEVKNDSVELSGALETGGKLRVVVQIPETDDEKAGEVILTYTVTGSESNWTVESSTED